MSPSAGRLPEPGLRSQNPHLLPQGAKRSRPLPLVTVKSFSRQRLSVFFKFLRDFGHFICVQTRKSRKKKSSRWRRSRPPPPSFAVFPRKHNLHPGSGGPKETWRAGGHGGLGL